MLLKKNIPVGYIFGKIKTELIFITIYATIIAILYENEHLTRISIPISVPTVMGTVISLLLGFRSNQAYDRWWEARQIWGAIVNESRTLARQTISFTSNLYEDDAIHHFRRNMIKRQIAWCFGLEKMLRKKIPTRDLDKWLHKKELEGLVHYDNVPIGILDLQARDIKMALDKGWINSYQHVELDRTLTRLCDAQGKCERIKNTVFPVTYSLYIHFSLLLFICLLPFGIIEYFGFFEVPLVSAIAASFLLIEKMAIHLQDPFENKPTDTPMTTISKGIEKTLNQMMAERVEQPVEENANAQVEKYYYLL